MNEYLLLPNNPVSAARTVQLLPWTSQAPRPWQAGYERVMIPYTDEEKRTSKGTHHIQVVRSSKLLKVPMKFLFQ